MVITMAKLRMAHASMHGARKPPGPIFTIKHIPPMEHTILFTIQYQVTALHGTALHSLTIEPKYHILNQNLGEASKLKLGIP